MIDKIRVINMINKTAYNKQKSVQASLGRQQEAYEGEQYDNDNAKHMQDLEAFDTGMGRQPNLYELKNNLYFDVNDYD